MTERLCGSTWTKKLLCASIMNARMADLWLFILTKIKTREND